VRVCQPEEQLAAWGQGLDVWLHQSGELEAEWGRALGGVGQTPYVTGHEWQR